MMTFVLCKSFGPSALGAIAACCFAAPGFAAEYLSAARDGVNLRSGPSTRTEAIFQVPAGYPLKTLERQGDWIKVEDYEGDRGWVMKTLVTSGRSVIVKVPEAKIRKEPSSKAPELGKALKEVIFTKKAVKGDWVNVAHGKTEGWVHRTLLWP